MCVRQNHSSGHVAFNRRHVWLIIWQPNHWKTGLNKTERQHKYSKPGPDSVKSSLAVHINHEGIWHFWIDKKKTRIQFQSCQDFFLYVVTHTTKKKYCSVHQSKIYRQSPQRRHSSFHGSIKAHWVTCGALRMGMRRGGRSSDCVPREGWGKRGVAW